MAEWKTIKVPEADKEQADDYRPDSATWGDCLVAGADRLNETQGTDMSHRVVDEIEPEEFAEMVASAVDAEVTLREGVEVEDIAQRVVANLEFSQVESSLATIEERTGKLERMLEGLQG